MSHDAAFAVSETDPSKTLNTRISLPTCRPSANPAGVDQNTPFTNGGATDCCRYDLPFA
jgi:hypothetical protein